MVCGVVIEMDSLRTGLLLLEGQLRPVCLHSVTESHPEISLLLWWHGLPSLLDIGEGWVGDGVAETLLDNWGLDEGAASAGADDRGAQHDDIYDICSEI